MKAFEILGVIIDTLWAKGYYLMSLINNEDEKNAVTNSHICKMKTEPISPQILANQSIEE